MPRAHVGPVVRIAMSPTKLATALDLDYHDVIAPAIRSGALPVYQVGTKRRVLIEDAANWLRTFKKGPRHD